MVSSFATDFRHTRQICSCSIFWDTNGRMCDSKEKSGHHSMMGLRYDVSRNAIPSCWLHITCFSPPLKIISDTLKNQVLDVTHHEVFPKNSHQVTSLTLTPEKGSVTVSSNPKSPDPWGCSPAQTEQHSTHLGPFMPYRNQGREGHPCMLLVHSGIRTP